ncbi:Cleft lip and palate transmembrane protein 1, partial [Trichostrongylus colubriformis]
RIVPHAKCTSVRCAVSRHGSSHNEFRNLIVTRLSCAHSMADVVAAAPNAGENQGDGGGGAWAAIKSLASRMLMIYFVTSLIKSYTDNSHNTDSNVTRSAGKHPPCRNLFPPGQLFDVYLYLDVSKDRFSNFADRNLFHQEKGIRYGDYSGGPEKDGTYYFHKTIPTPEVLMRNQSIYLHTFITKSGFSPNPHHPSYVKQEVIYGVRQLNKFRKKYYKQTANLLTGKTEQSKDDAEKATKMNFEILNFWHPNLTINLVDDQTQWSEGSLPPPFDEAIVFNTAGGFYLPILYFNDYWNLASEYAPVNDTVKEITLRISYQPLSLFKYQLYASQQTRSKLSSMLGNDQEDDDQDAIKQALLETNPIVLGVTVLVSLLHTVFEFLAFKNDIQFWHSRKDLAGLSVRSVLFNIFQSLIVFLYICDNDTNWVVKISVGVGLLIECWKIPKVVNVEVDYSRKWLGVIPSIKVSDKGSYVESDTKTYDDMAFKYLSWVLFPLLGGYAIYSLIFVEQRGWYSWVLNMLYGFLLMFGFITMTPQLFINYKLKSVAHLPWRMLTYKFINTFIDDLFAFVIRMPMMYRIGCFRDDIIFIIYLYQRWVYRVDPKRVNEFGSSLEPSVNSEDALRELVPKEATTCLDESKSQETKKDR